METLTVQGASNAQVSATFMRNNTQPVLLVFYRKLQFHFLSS
jgi:hypothetical protein